MICIERKEGNIIFEVGRRYAELRHEGAEKARRIYENWVQNASLRVYSDLLEEWTIT